MIAIESPLRARIGIDIDAPADAAWEALVDLDAWPDWGPTVRAARLDDGTRRLHGPGTGSVQTLPGLWLRFRIDSWQEDTAERRWAWRVAGVPATDHVVRRLGPASCRVEMSVPWWGSGYLGVLALALSRIRRRAEG